MTDDIRVDTTIARAHESRERALSWLAAHIDSVGAPAHDAPATAARGPLAFAYAGRFDLANRHLSWLAEVPREALSFGIGARYGSYPLALLAQGAVAASRWDLARELHSELVNWLAPCGAPWSRAQTGCGETEIAPSAQVGITLLGLGDHDRANRIGEYLVAAWRAQPEPGERLFMLTDGEGELITELPQAADESERKHRVLERAGERQHFYVPGIMAAFLVQLHWATGESVYLQVAQECQEFAMNQPHQFETLQVCKTAWSSAFLWVATAEEAHRAWTEQLGNWFVDTQLGDGSWVDHNSPYSLASKYSVTAEFLQHLTFVMWALGHRPETD